MIEYSIEKCLIDWLGIYLIWLTFNWLNVYFTKCSIDWLIAYSVLEFHCNSLTQVLIGVKSNHFIENLEKLKKNFLLSISESSINLHKMQSCGLFQILFDIPRWSYPAGIEHLSYKRSDIGYQDQAFKINDSPHKSSDLWEEKKNCIPAIVRMQDDKV